MEIRSITPEDAEGFYAMLCRLDDETDYMLYEPGERAARTRGAASLRARLESGLSNGDLVLGASDEAGALTGFLWAERGGPKRVRHTAYLVVGVREAYRGRGIGTALFRRLDAWARENGVKRLELTVECENEAALRLYEKCGFHAEGRRAGSMMVNGKFTDEIYMAKLPEG